MRKAILGARFVTNLKNLIKPIAKTSLLKYNKDVLGCKGEGYEIYW